MLCICHLWGARPFIQAIEDDSTPHFFSHLSGVLLWRRVRPQTAPFPDKARLAVRHGQRGRVCLSTPLHTVAQSNLDQDRTLRLWLKPQ